MFDFLPDHFFQPFRIGEHLCRLAKVRPSPDGAVVVTHLTIAGIDDVLAGDIADDVQIDHI